MPEEEFCGFDLRKFVFRHKPNRISIWVSGIFLKGRNYFDATANSFANNPRNNK
tara:strand:- start:121 stop:282 length:162 start_codon:yes stop_codon:yes gene_type:complete